MTTRTPISRTRRAVAAVGALALATLGIAGVAAPAMADPGNIIAPDPGTSSIVIHKYEKTSTNGTVAGDGTLATPSGTPIDGVTFRLQEVVTTPGNASIDLLSNAGWTQVAAVEGAWSATNPTVLPSGYTLTAGSTWPTSGGGIATFDSLHYGLYLVTEESPMPDNVTDPALPFLVTVPFPTGASHPTDPNDWLYTVHVYPKNAVTGVTKVVKSSDTAFHTAADFVTWTITADVPSLPSGGFDTFTISDTIDPAQLEFVTGVVPAGISPRAVRVFNAVGAEVSSNFTTPADYDYTLSGTYNEVQTLTFTPAGRADLATYAQGGRVEFDVPTQLVAVPSNGIVTNQTHLVVNDGTDDSSANQDFGKLRVFKYAETGTTPFTKTPLAGATFRVYYDANADGVADPGELVTVDAVDSWTTLPNGLLDIPALKPSDATHKYLLVETAAPVGYQALTAPVVAEVVAGDVVTAAPFKNYVEVKNSQVPPWMLPFTGGNGVLTFTIAGAGLMALAFGFAFLAFRRRKRAQQA